MKDYIYRMLDERKDLVEKCGKLTRFKNNNYHNLDQHFTTFTPPRKLMKLVYTRPELSPLDFLRFGP